MTAGKSLLLLGHITVLFGAIYLLLGQVRVPPVSCLYNSQATKKQPGNSASRILRAGERLPSTRSSWPGRRHLSLFSTAQIQCSHLPSGPSSCLGPLGTMEEWMAPLSSDPLASSPLRYGVGGSFLQVFPLLPSSIGEHRTVMGGRERHLKMQHTCSGRLGALTLSEGSGFGYQVLVGWSTVRSLSI